MGITTDEFVELLKLGEDLQRTSLLCGAATATLSRDFTTEERAAQAAWQRYADRLKELMLAQSTVPEPPVDPASLIDTDCCQ